jgi:hypothetical protein
VDAARPNPVNAALLLSRPSQLVGRDDVVAPETPSRRQASVARRRIARSTWTAVCRARRAVGSCWAVNDQPTMTRLDDQRRWLDSPSWPVGPAW